jgi:tetratricopeptide (TPR) repeat protein
MRNVLLALCLVTAAPAFGATARDRMIADCDDDKSADRAIAACRALIASNTETQAGLVVTHTALGYANFRKEMWAQAIREFDFALDLDVDGSHSYRLLLLRGVAYSANCQLDAALADANRAMALKPAEATPYFNRGLVWLRKGDAARAGIDFAQAHHMRPDDFPTPEQAFGRPRPPECLVSAPTRG